MVWRDITLSKSGQRRILERSPVAVGLELLESPPGDVDIDLVHCFVATIGLFPVETLVELQNGDAAVVADIEHLRGRNLYNQRPASGSKKSIP